MKKSIIKLITLSSIVFVGAILPAQESPKVSVLSLLNDEQKTKFGLKKLDEDEFKKLDKWTTDMVVQSLQQTTEPADLEGSIILSGDDEYLGKITSNTFDSKSLGNEFGKYGNEFESKSLFNKFSKYSDSFSNTSAFCLTATKPPLILLKGKMIAYLTINRSISPRANPYAVIGYCKYGRQAGIDVNHLHLNTPTENYIKKRIPDMSDEVRFVLFFLDDERVGDKMSYLGFAPDPYFFHRSGDLFQINETAYEVINIRQVISPQIGELQVNVRLASHHTAER